ncbi:dioxygenase [Streptomyces sp. NPDC087420]|uniref:dioxygenase family protein n=1 Tax=Streptomyces sp. NPDC087420 TaxID=3365785 RepID=UPI00383448B3
MATAPVTPGFDEGSATALVNASWQNAPTERLKTLLSSLVSHLHDFVRDVEPTPEEWLQGIDFLTAAGQKCDDVRQEFILLSDILGVSMLVDAINNRKPVGATPSTVLGPFHMVDSPPRELGADISLDANGTPCVVAGHVRSMDGTPLPGALVDIWQANGDGLYDVQQPDKQPALNLRGLFTTDSDGRYWLRSVVPRHYPVPTDGPVGDLLRASERHAYRPAHLHFIAGAQGHRPVTTHLFAEGSPYLDSDAVFGVKSELIRPVVVIDDEVRAAEFGVQAPFHLIEFDIVLDQAQADTRDMHMVHTMFRREFAALPALVRGVAAEDAERLAVVADHVTFLSGVLEAHHRAEDVHLWPRLLDRGSGKIAPLVQMMEGHHERIEELGTQVTAALTAWRKRATTERAEALAQVLHRLADVLHEHMTLEERHILPLAEKYVTATEWRAMAGTSGAGLPPGSMPLVFGMTLYEADPEVIENTLSSLPSEVRTLLREQGARDFATYSERVHGTPTPRRSAPPGPRT